MKEIELPKITDGRGNLSFFESERAVPFKIKGVFLINIYNTGEEYKFTNNDYSEFFITPLSGSFLFNDNSVTEKELNCLFLKNANKSLYIESNIDFTLCQFAENTVILILSSKESINFVRKI
nr:WxcM-like domain-containing protein [uncultured Treponema sp.]